MLMSSYTLLDVLLYTLYQLGGRVRGVKKLMKLLFLEDYEKRGDVLVAYQYAGRPVTRAAFVIWDFGPFSRDVYDAMDEREELFAVTDPEPPVEITLTPRGVEQAKQAALNLPEPVRRRVEHVAARYGGYSGGELARIVYEMLGLDEAVKEEYKGVSVERYLDEMRIRVKRVDLASAR